MSNVWRCTTSEMKCQTAFPILLLIWPQNTHMYVSHTKNENAYWIIWIQIFNQITHTYVENCLIVELHLNFQVYTVILIPYRLLYITLACSYQYVLHGNKIILELQIIYCCFVPGAYEQLLHIINFILLQTNVDIKACWPTSISELKCVFSHIFEPASYNNNSTWSAKMEVVTLKKQIVQVSGH